MGSLHVHRCRPNQASKPELCPNGGLRDRLSAAERKEGVCVYVCECVCV